MSLPTPPPITLGETPNFRAAAALVTFWNAHEDYINALRALEGVTIPPERVPGLCTGLSLTTAACQQAAARLKNPPVQS